MPVPVWSTSGGGMVTGISGKPGKPLPGSKRSADDAGSAPASGSDARASSSSGTRVVPAPATTVAAKAPARPRSAAAGTAARKVTARAPGEAPAKAAGKAPAATPAKPAGKPPAKAAAKAAKTTAKAPAKTAAKAPAKTAAKAPAARRPPQAAPGRTAPTGDDAWTQVELEAVRKELEAQAEALRSEIDTAEAVSASLKLAQSSEGSGDEADAGSKTFEREHEMSLSNNSRDLLVQVERALGRLHAGTYGQCENCGNAIPKARLQAFPRVTLCVACKQREERR